MYKGLAVKSKQKKKKIGESGITLIALVITIVVLLILVAVTVSALTGDNGILTNTRNARSSNAYYSAEEQLKIAHMSVRTEIEMEVDKDSSYDATSTSNPDNVTALADIVRKDLNIPAGSEVANSAGYKVVTDVSNATVPKIKVTYTNGKIQAGTIEPGKPSENGKIEYEIKLQPQNAILERALIGINYGTKTATTIDVGEDFTIGTESFRVLSKSSTQIVAVPHLNITLDKTNPVQSSSAGTTTFIAQQSDIYWTIGQDDIDWTNDKCLLKPYIIAYSNKLDKATGNTGRVLARLGKRSEFLDSAIILPGEATVTKAQIRNSESAYNFWLGSNYSQSLDRVFFVPSDGSISYIYACYSFSYSVRPVVVIDIS